MSIDRFTFQKAGLALALMIVINLFVYVGVINTFFPEPDFETECPAPAEDLTTEEACTEVGGKWYTSYQDEYSARYGGVAVKPLADEDFKPYCDAYYTCRTDFENATKEYSRNIFIVSVVLGTVALVAGIFFVDVSAISSGLLLAGLLLYFIGTVRYWSDMDEYLRLIVLGLVLIALFYVGYKRLNDRRDMSPKE